MIDTETEIYIKAEPKIIREVLELVRNRIGEGVDIVDLKPNYNWEKEDI
jgi:DNA-binding protein